MTDLQPIYKCPYCMEEVQPEAIKCKHCGEFFQRESKTDNTQIVLVGCVVGAFILLLASAVLSQAFLNPGRNDNKNSSWEKDEKKEEEFVPAKMDDIMKQGAITMVSRAVDTALGANNDKKLDVLVEKKPVGTLYFVTGTAMKNGEQIEIKSMIATEGETLYFASLNIGDVEIPGSTEGLRILEKVNEASIKSP